METHTHTGKPVFDTCFFFFFGGGGWGFGFRVSMASGNAAFGVSLATVFRSLISTGFSHYLSQRGLAVVGLSRNRKGPGKPSKEGRTVVEYTRSEYAIFGSESLKRVSNGSLEKTSFVPGPCWKAWFSYQLLLYFKVISDLLSCFTGRVSGFHPQVRTKRSGEKKRKEKNNNGPGDEKAAWRELPQDLKQTLGPGMPGTQPMRRIGRNQRVFFFLFSFLFFFSFSFFFLFPPVGGKKEHCRPSTSGFFSAGTWSL